MIYINITEYIKPSSSPHQGCQNSLLLQTCCRLLEMMVYLPLTPAVVDCSAPAVGPQVYKGVKPIFLLMLRKLQQSPCFLNTESLANLISCNVALNDKGNISHEVPCSFLPFTLMMFVFFPCSPCAFFILQEVLMLFSYLGKFWKLCEFSFNCILSNSVTDDLKHLYNLSDYYLSMQTKNIAVELFIVSIKR